MSGRRAAVAALTVAIGAEGCTAMSTVKTATTVPRGETQVFAAVEGNGGAPVELGGKLTSLPLGRRITTAALEAQIKVQLRRRPDSRFEVAVGPATGFRWISSSGASMQVSYATLPLLLGCNVGRHQIVVAPEAGLQLWTSAGAGHVWAPVAGLTLGFVWRLGERFALVPEASAYRSRVAIDYSRGTSMIHLGVGMLF